MHTYIHTYTHVHVLCSKLELILVCCSSYRLLAGFLSLRPAVQVGLATAPHLRENHCVYWPRLYGYGYDFKASPSGCLAFTCFTQSLFSFMLPNSKTCPAPPFPFPPCCCTVQLTDCVSNSMKARRKMPFIIFTSRGTTRTVGSSTFHTQWGHLQDMLLLFLLLPVVFVVLWLIIIICAFYISVFYCSTFLIHSHTHAHRDTVAYSLRNRRFSLTSHWVQQVAYTTSATSFVAADSC